MRSLLVCCQVMATVDNFTIQGLEAWIGYHAVSASGKRDVIAEYKVIVIGAVCQGTNGITTVYPVSSCAAN